MMLINKEQSQFRILFGDKNNWDAEADRAVRDDIDTLFYDSLPSVEFIQKYVEVGDLIDCGCNVGRCVEAYTNAGFTYVGVDQSAHAVELARRFHPNNEFLVSFLWDLTYDQEFDVAVCNAVLQHNTLEEKRRIIPAIYNSLKKGGVFFFAESTVEAPTETQLTYDGWIKLLESVGFVFLESEHENDIGVHDEYLFQRVK